ncbi:MAG: 4'-phosphopantetheinyl transferase family protein [Acidimicrobiales bacterium]
MGTPAGPEWPSHPLGPGLPAREVHLWLAGVEAGTEHADLLAADEQARAARFRDEGDRRRWEASRVLLRAVLGRYLGTGPGAVVFDEEDQGRPVVRRPEGSGWLGFSLSHAGALAVVAVARGREVGVDIEEVRPGLDVVAIARRALGEAAAADLALRSPAERLDAFYRAWVRAEARGKCRGTGLVEPGPAEPSDQPGVADLELCDGYAGAVARPGAPPVVRRCRLVV